MFEWDEAKAAANLAKHQIAFGAAARALMGEHVVTNLAKGKGEVRFLSFAETGGVEIAVVWTLREEAIRIISARRAKRHERRAYREEIARRTGGYPG